MVQEQWLKKPAADEVDEARWDGTLTNKLAESSYIHNINGSGSLGYLEPAGREVQLS